MGCFRSTFVASFFVALIAALAPCRGLLAGEAPLTVGDAAPDWILANSQDDYLSFYKDSGNQPAVLLFWATWCQYCVELMPELHSLREQYADEGVKFYAINIWEDGDPVAYMANNNFKFTLLLQGDMVAKRYGVNGTPGLIVVGADKEIRYVRPNGQSPEAACDQIATVLNAELEEENLARR